MYTQHSTPGVRARDAPFVFSQIPALVSALWLSVLRRAVRRRALDVPSMGPSHCLSCSKALLLGGWVLLGASWGSWGSWGTMCTTCPRAHSPSPRAPQYGNRARRPVAQRSEHLGRNLVVISTQLRREARISATATWDSGCTAPSRPASLATAPWRRSISSGLAR